jgi:quinoprotein glucose dehydrogenase
MFTPPSKEGSFIFPGFDGGGEWGGASVDPETAIMYVNTSELPWTLTMIDIPANNNDRSISGIGKNVYNQYCIACHGTDLKGNGPAYPSITEVHKLYNANSLKKLIDNGKNMMPSFKQIPENEKDALVAFLMKSPFKEPTGALKSTHHQEVLKKETSEAIEKENREKYRSPYVMTGYNRFLDKNGYPGIKPPWGTLNAIDLNNGKLLWKVPLGEYEELSRKGIPITGTENYGGPVSTKGGLVFIAATKDSKFRAFDKKNGRMLWETNLPVPGYATPSVYFANGKQYVVIACGGGKIGSKSGDEYIAFALP